MNIIRTAHFHSADYFDSLQTPQRLVRRWELEYYTGGDGFSIIGDRKYPHAGSHFLLARPGDERFSIGRFDCSYVHFETDLPTLDDIPAYIPIDPTASAATMLPLPADPLRALAALCTLLAMLREQTAVPSVHEPYMDRILASKAYIDSHYAEHLTLDTLAAPTYLSKNFYRSTFARIMEVSPTVYLRRVRVAHALTLLRETDFPYAEVALRCGFESQSYLNRVLRAETGKTPAMLRHRA